MRTAVQDFSSNIVLGPKKRNFCDLEYADDIAIMTDSAEELQKAVSAIALYGASYGLVLKSAKSKVLVTQPAKRTSLPISIEGEAMETVTSFCYLGSVITTNGDCVEDVNHRVE